MGSCDDQSKAVGIVVDQADMAHLDMPELLGLADPIAEPVGEKDHSPRMAVVSLDIEGNHVEEAPSWAADHTVGARHSHTHGHLDQKYSYHIDIGQLEERSGHKPELGPHSRESLHTELGRTVVLQ